jgi:nitrous oxidase accessory protein
VRILLTILFIVCCTICFGKTITVSKSGVISSLRTAAEQANDGDTIILHKGVYKEGNIIIKKSIRLIGIDNPVLDGENKYEILTISGTRILIKGIHFKNSGYSSTNDFASVSVIDGSYIIIENNAFDGAYFAIKFANANHSIIRNNTIKSHHKTEQTSGNGIHLWKCDNMLVADNSVSGHRDGIYFEFVTNSIIESNYSEKNIRYGLHFMFSNNDSYIKNTFKNNGAGVAVMYSHHVVMHSNLFEYNWGTNAYGILLKEISDSKIYKNDFVQNTVGILMESTNRIEVQQNAFQGNGWAFRIQASCDQNVVHHNNFQGNTFDIATNGSLMLNEFSNNYWDKYDGYDLDRDGVGDVPYHPVSLYSMVIEQNPNSVLLLRSFMVTLLDKSEKAVPSLTPEQFADDKPLMKSLQL